VGPATSSAPERERRRTPLARLPIRLRLAVSVGAVTFVVLLVFAIAVGTLTVHRLRSNFNSNVVSQATYLGAELHFHIVAGGMTVSPNLDEFASIAGGAARILTLDGTVIAASTHAPNLGLPSPGASVVDGYRVVSDQVGFGNGNSVFVQYGLPVGSLNSEIQSLDLLLILGVLAGTALAIGAGSLVARRAIAPIAELTEAAATIEQTGDPTLTLPHPTADDEVAELSRTLATMLSSLADARGRTEASLDRQRAFVADASHELRTPLTSVLANLELLTEALHGQERDVARSALRSTQRMRRLVADLLLLARSDVKQATAAEPLDLAELVIAAAGELEPTSDGHAIELKVRPTPLLGNPDDLQRVAINLIENAIRHTPAGTQITVSTRPLRDGQAELVVADNGPGIAPEVRKHLFERFVRGGGESSGSLGLGLAIVQAVTEAHNGTIDVRSTPRSGTRFSVHLAGRPAAPAAANLTVTPA